MHIIIPGIIPGDGGSLAQSPESGPGWIGVEGSRGNLKFEIFKNGPHRYDAVANETEKNSTR